MIQNLIFDFDGVIADTFDINFALSVDMDPSATREDFLAHHDGNVFEEPRIIFHPDRVHTFHSEYAKRVSPTHMAQAIEPLRRLAHAYKLYIISSNRESSIKEILAKANIENLFARVMGEETHKSKVEKFKILISDCGITPHNSIFITDTLGDIKEAHKVGIRSIGVSFGFHDRDRLALGKPLKIVDSWQEIEDFLKEIR